MKIIFRLKILKKDQMSREYLIERNKQRSYIIAHGSVSTLVAFDHNDIKGSVYSILSKIPNNKPCLEKYLALLANNVPKIYIIYN
jgi:hypothetical protein